MRAVGKDLFSRETGGSAVARTRIALARLACFVRPFSHTGVAMSHWWPLKRLGTDVGRVRRRGL